MNKEISMRSHLRLYTRLTRLATDVSLITGSFTGCIRSDSFAHLSSLILRMRARWRLFLILLLFGPPGCGKGTQAVFLADRFHIPAISTGEMFRAECKAGTELGRTACAIMTAGGLVTDDITNTIVSRRISQPDCANG